MGAGVRRVEETGRERGRGRGFTVLIFGRIPSCMPSQGNLPMWEPIPGVVPAFGEGVGFCLWCGGGGGGVGDVDVGF